MRGSRTHDLLYLNENRYKDVKESFKFTLANALEFASSTPMRVLDVGCAAGEFAHYLVRALPQARVHGIDLLPELVEKARENVPEATFSVGEVLDDSSCLEQYDMVFLVGVHSIFDEIEPWLSNLLKWTRSGGTVVVFGLINTHPIDAFIRIRTQADNDSHREPGWNNFSKATFDRIISGRDDVVRHSYTDFTIPIDLPPREDDRLRSWTEKASNGQRYILNGIGLVHDFKVLCIEKGVVTKIQSEA